MSISNTSSSDVLTQQVTIYLGISILTIGLPGNFINVVVFLSLQTFRQNSSAFYLTIMSIVNIGHLLTGLFTRIMISGFNIDWTQSSVFYCKFRPYWFQSCVSISMTCMCLATMDQFLATCSSLRWQQWSNIKIAHRLTIGSIVIWLIYGIPNWIYFNQTKSVLTGQYICGNGNTIFQIYNISVQIVVLNGFLPILISMLFGLLAYRNVQDLGYRAIPLVRRELDKQLTVIVVIQAASQFITTIPYVIVYIFILKATIMNDTVSLNRLGFANILTLCLFYLSFASPFYMYISVSERFRQQFIYVFFKIRFNQCRRRVRVVNQIIPQE